MSTLLFILEFRWQSHVYLNLFSLWQSITVCSLKEKRKVCSLKRDGILLPSLSPTARYTSPLNAFILLTQLVSTWKSHPQLPSLGHSRICTVSLWSDHLQMKLSSSTPSAVSPSTVPLHSNILQCCLLVPKEKIPAPSNRGEERLGPPDQQLLDAPGPSEVSSQPWAQVPAASSQPADLQ